MCQVTNQHSGGFGPKSLMVFFNNQITALWIMPSCNDLIGYQHHGDQNMGVACFLEMLVTYHITTWCHSLKMEAA
jgi:hypothetical protein